MSTATIISKPETVCLQAPHYETDDLPAVAGLVEINGVLYTLLPNGNQSNQGFRLTNLRNSQVYDISTSSGRPVCDCPDATYRKRRCKHASALQQLRNDRVI